MIRVLLSFFLLSASALTAQQPAATSPTALATENRRLRAENDSLRRVITGLRSRAQTSPATSRASGRQAGVVEGDVYLMMQSGDVRRGAGLRVRLLGRPTETMAAIAARCAEWRRYYSENQGNSSALLDVGGPQLERDLAAILAKEVLFETGSGVNAHYRFEAVPPGDYLVFAVFPIGNRNYRWLLPVTVTAGGSTTMDLDTEKENRALIGCGWS